MDARADAHRAVEGLGKTARHQTREGAFPMSGTLADLRGFTGRGKGGGSHMGFAATQKGMQIRPLAEQAEPQPQTALTGMEFPARRRRGRHLFHERSVPETACDARPRGRSAGEPCHAARIVLACVCRMIHSTREGCI